MGSVGHVPGNEPATLAFQPGQFGEKRCRSSELFKTGNDEKAHAKATHRISPLKYPMKSQPPQKTAVSLEYQENKRHYGRSDIGIAGGLLSAG
jgi:hypothetical protein